MRFYQYLYFVTIIVIIFSCKNTKKQIQNVNIVKNKNDTINLINNDTTLYPFISKLPLGSNQLISKELEKLNINKIILKNIFRYYDTIDGIASPFFKPINIPKYNSFYKPSKADTLKRSDIFVLKSKENYPFFKLTRVISLNNKNLALIFEGQSTNYDYDGNNLFINRKDIVIIDSKNKILDEMNLYYAYSDGINAKNKFFLIDVEFNIYIRYYFENEEGKSRFSEIERYKILPNGKIIEQ